MAGIVVYASLNHAALDRGIVEANAKVGKFARDIQRQGAGIEAEMGNQLKRAAERLPYCRLIRLPRPPLHRQFLRQSPQPGPVVRRRMFRP